jgi:lipopolysaccharide transport system ATP-binding protein
VYILKREKVYDWVDEIMVFEVNNSIVCEGLVDLQSKINIKEIECIVEKK